MGIYQDKCKRCGWLNIYSSIGGFKQIGYCKCAEKERRAKEERK